MPGALLGSLDSEGEYLHVLDLPQLFEKPRADQLLDALALLSLQPPSWDIDIPQRKSQNGAIKANAVVQGPRVVEDGVTHYLTSIIASQLRWIKDADAQDKIYEQASLRLSERSGRSAMPAMTRVFRVPSEDFVFDVQIHEPSLTADNLGFKTWAASYLLAKRLHQLDIPRHRSRHGVDERLPVLELGSGTGLVGISAAAVLGASVFLTDLPEITDNLYKNAIANLEVSRANGGTTTTAVLDWTAPHLISPVDLVSDVPTDFPVIMAADSIYAPEHPAMLVNAIKTWLSPEHNARVLIELPIRPGSSHEHNELRLRMSCIGLTCLNQGHETGFDDWGYTGRDSDLQEVDCWWSIWGWRGS